MQRGNTTFGASVWTVMVAVVGALAIAGVGASLSAQAAGRGAERAIPVSEGYVTAPDGNRLYYKIIGHAPDTIVAIHGGPGETMAEFDPALMPLVPRHALLLYDQRGNGRSSVVGDSTHLAVSYHISDLEAILQHFAIRRATLLGHSWGGGLVALYAAAHPAAVARLILVDPVAPRLRPFGIQSNHARLAGADSATLSRIAVLSGAARADTAHDKAALCREIYDLLLKNYFVSRDAMTHTIAGDCADSSYSLARAYRVGTVTSGSWGEWVWDTLMTHVPARALVIHGANDFIPVAASDAWASAFPNGRLLVIGRSGHFPFVERPDEFFPAIETFLEGGWPPSATRGHPSP